MEIGGTDLLFHTTGAVNVLQVVTDRLRAIWPRLVVEDISPDEGPFGKKELFIYQDQATKDMLGEDYQPGNLYIHLLYRRSGQTANHFIQDVTLVVDDFNEDMFPVINAIQADFLRGFVRTEVMPNRSPEYHPRPGDLFLTPDGRYLMVDIADALIISFVRDDDTAGSFHYYDGWTAFAKDFKLIEMAEQTTWPWPKPASLDVHDYIVTIYPQRTELQNYIRERIQANQPKVETDNASQ